MIQGTLNPKNSKTDSLGDDVPDGLVSKMDTIGQADAYAKYLTHKWKWDINGMWEFLSRKGGSVASSDPGSSGTPRVSVRYSGGQTMYGRARKGARRQLLAEIDSHSD